MDLELLHVCLHTCEYSHTWPTYKEKYIWELNRKLRCYAVRLVLDLYLKYMLHQVVSFFFSLKVYSTWWWSLVGLAPQEDERLLEIRRGPRPA